MSLTLFREHAHLITPAARVQVNWRGFPATFDSIEQKGMVEWFVSEAREYPGTCRWFSELRSSSEQLESGRSLLPGQ